MRYEYARSIAFLFCILPLVAALPAQADFVSTFDSDAEGWGIYANGVAPVADYEPVGGNPGGFIKESDIVSDTWYFAAPSTWSGDMTAYIGGTLSFQIIVLHAGGGYFSASDVRIWDGIPGAPGTSSMYWYSGIIPPRPPDEAWTDFLLEIVPENFSIWPPTGSDATFESIMANVVAIHIRGEYMGASDTEGLDNVILLPYDTSAETAPEFPALPERTGLAWLQPNPFNPRIVVAYDLAVAAPVEVAVYDLRGRRIRTLVAESRPAGRHETAWDGRDEAGRSLSNGVYIVRLTTPGMQDARKATLAK